MTAFVALLERVRRAVPVRLLADFHALGLVEEYVRFLALKLTRNDTRTLPPLLSPSYAVDQVWQTHMLHPQAYVATCRALLPREANGDSAVIVHSPVPSEGFDERYANTLACYKERIGIMPNQDMWPPALPTSAPSSQLPPPAQRVATATLAPELVHSANASPVLVAPSLQPPLPRASRTQLPPYEPSSPPLSSQQTTATTVQVPALVQERCNAAHSTIEVVLSHSPPLSLPLTQLPVAHEPWSPTQSGATDVVPVPERRRTTSSAVVLVPSPPSPSSRRKRSRSLGRTPRDIVVYVNVPFGPKYAFALPRLASVAQLQERIAEHVRVPIAQQNLLI